MKIIAHGKESINAAVATAEVALTAGVKSVMIECTPSSMLSEVIATTLAYCPVAGCSECAASPCPFERQQPNKAEEAQAAYDLAFHNLKVAEDNLRMVNANG